MILALWVALAAASTSNSSLPDAGNAAADMDIAKCEKWVENRSTLQHDLEGQLEVISPQVACFDGGITKKSVKSVEEWLGRARPAGSSPTLVVYSYGGDGEGGLELAEKLDSANASVLVDGMCASSCADYLFAGVPNRSVTNGSMILFHGGITAKARTGITKAFARFQQMKLIKPADIATQEKAALEQLDALIKRQDDLYRRSGVDPILVEGFDDLNMKSIAEDECDPTRDLPHDFIVFSDAQMRRLGLTVRSGKPDTDPAKINQFAAAIGKKHEICRAPEAFFKVAKSSATSLTQSRRR